MTTKIKRVFFKTQLYLLDGLRKFFDWLFKPFSSAESLDQYYDRGYWYGLLFLLIAGIIFFILDYFGLYLGFLTIKGTDLPFITKYYIRKVIELFGYKPDVLREFSWFPIYFLIPAVYLSFYFITSFRRKIGELFTKFFTFIFNKSTHLGEWFIKHRWMSIITILIVCALITVGFYYLIDKRIRREQLRTDLKNWFEKTEQFIFFNTLSKNDNNEYKEKIERLWKADFEQTFKASDKQESSFSKLKKQLKEIYGKANLSKSWFAHLKEVELLDVNRKYIPNKYSTKEEIRASCLTYIFIARVHNRKFQHEFNESNSNPDILNNPESLKVSLNLALDSLISAEKSLKLAKEALDMVKKTEDDILWTNTYNSSIHNALGNISSNYFMYIVKKSKLPENITINDITSEECKYPRDCVAKAEAHFKEATKEFNECSFESRRSTNNITDLYVRIGVSYEEYAKHESLDETKDEMSRIQLAELLDKNVESLTKCFNKDFIPLILVTISQALAKSADLKIKENKSEQEVMPQLSNSARYLKLAYNFSESNNYLTWEIEPFCEFIKKPSMEDELGEQGDLRYQNYQQEFKTVLEKNDIGDLMSPYKQLSRLANKVCQ